MKEGAIELDPNQNLDKIYRDHPPESQLRLTGSITKHSATSASSSKSNEEIILSKDAISRIVNEFHLSTQTEAEILRALDQATQRLREKKV